MGSAASVGQNEEEVEEEEVKEDDYEWEENEELARREATGPTVTLKRVSRPPDSVRDKLMRRADSFEKNPIVISRSGFSKQAVSITAGQVVTFVWEDLESTGYNVTQVVHDGDQYRPVVGGIHSGSLTQRGHFENQFNVEGEYKFVSAGIRCTPLTITVQSRGEIFCRLTDTGFQPPLIRVDQTESVKWSWAQLDQPHAMYQASFCRQHAALRRVDSGKLLQTLSGSYTYDFKQPGLYYFVASSGSTKMHLCIVEVCNSPKEYKIEITDRSFEPAILVIEEGDRVWWTWDRLKCQKLHCVYQVDAPERKMGKEESYKPTPQGFRWPQPSKAGLVSHVFNETGVYFYSDHNLQETAVYAGTIIVKPKMAEHFIKLSPEGFEPDLTFVTTGERIWWQWDAKEMESLFTIMEVEKCVSSSFKDLVMADECKNDCHYMDDKAARIAVRIGLETFTPFYPGVYHFRVSDSPNSITTSTIVANPGIRNYTVHVSDSGFEPRMLTVYPGDRVWWVWQKSTKSHNVVQVTHEGLPLEKGFVSGGKMEAPAAFLHKFMEAGVFYYVSEGLADKFGAIVVTQQPIVREVKVNAGNILPDPICVGLNDVVVWTFKGLRQHDLVPISSMGEITEALPKSNMIAPRRCLNRSFDNVGIYHFTSKAFVFGGVKAYHSPDDRRVSSVVVEECYDCEVVRVTSHGFFPPQTTIKQGQSVLWTWKSSGTEVHNIVHVNPPSSGAPLSVIQGDRSFSSGRPVSGQSFLYTFHRSGMFCVASVGAPGLSGTVLVLTSVPRTPAPNLAYERSDQQDGGAVHKGHVVELTCGMDARIYYTLEGSPPLLHTPRVKLYKPDEGIPLKRSDMFFVRAIAIAENHLTSDIFTSERFWIISDGHDGDSDRELGSSDEETLSQLDNPSRDTWQWFNCVPYIKHILSGPNSLELFWDPVPEEGTKLIKDYQVLLNDISYSKPFHPNVSSVSVEGLAAGKTYVIYVVVNSMNPMYMPHKSNRLDIVIPKSLPSGAPIISPESSENSDSLTVVWRCVDSMNRPLAGYQLILNGRKCGQLIVPNKKSARCKVVLDGCSMAEQYKIQIATVSKDESEEEVVSNTVSLVLPLDTEHIVYPDTLKQDENFFPEYIVVRVGKGLQLTAEDTPHSSESRRRRDLNRIFRPASNEVVDEEEEDEEDTLTAATSRDFLTPRETKQPAITNGYSQSEGDTTSRTSESHESEQPIKEERQMSPSGTEEESEEASSEECSSSSEEEEDDVEEESTLSGSEEEAQSVHDGAQPQTSEHKDLRGQKQVDHFIEQTPQKREETGGGQSPSDSSTPRSFMERGDSAVPSLGAVVAVQDSLDLGEEEPPRYSMEETLRGVATVKASTDIETASTLPVPIVEMQPLLRAKANTLEVTWRFDRAIPASCRLQICSVNVVGPEFVEPTLSDLSFLSQEKEFQSYVHHVWNISNDNRAKVKGLLHPNEYRLWVTAVFLDHSQEPPAELQVSSSTLTYRTQGSPRAPRLLVESVGLSQATVTWKVDLDIENDPVSSCQLLAFGEPFGDELAPSTNFMTFDNLKPGRSVSVSLLVRNSYGESVSSLISLSCPRAPPVPQPRQEPCFHPGTALIAWDHPYQRDCRREEDIATYSVYVDNVWRDDVAVVVGKRTYQYFLVGLLPGMPHDVTLKAIAGPKTVNPDAEEIFCQTESAMSSALTVTCNAPPISPALRVEAMTSAGIDITWETPQEFGEAEISGYRLLKDDQPYGAVLPGDVRSIRVKDVSFGDRVILQLVALTEHPVGKASADGASFVEGQDKPSDDLLPLYSACRPGPKLRIHFTGLVEPPSNVRCETVSGHSAMVVWSKPTKPHRHYVAPDTYQVTWWKGREPEKDVHSISTQKDCVLLGDLKPATLYTVTVEARKLQTYDEIDEEEGSDRRKPGQFIMTSQSEQLTVRTAEPPVAPSNLGILATTCNSILIAWDPPVERGSEVIGIVVRCSPVEKDRSQEWREVELMPDATRAVIDRLEEGKEYTLTVSAPTEEFLRSRTGNVAWRPSASIRASTAGTKSARNLQVLNVDSRSMKLQWKPPQVSGSNQLQGQIIRWAVVRDFGATKNRQQLNADEEPDSADYLTLDPRDKRITLENLRTGCVYRVVVEAVVSVKSVLETDPSQDDDTQNRRTAHVPCEPLFVRTRSPNNPPRLLVSAVTPDAFTVSWEKPSLYALLPGENAGDDPRFIRHHLEGYRLLVNGRPHLKLKPSAQSCTLNKCKAEKDYSVTLSALTLTSDAKRDAVNSRSASRLTRSSSVDEDAVSLDLDTDLDETPSDPVTVKLHPSSTHGAIRSLSAEFVSRTEEEKVTRDGDMVDAIVVQWELAGSVGAVAPGNIKQINLSWECDSNRKLIRKTLDPQIRETKITPVKPKSVYSIHVEPVSTRETSHPLGQRVQVVTPGPPDAPRVCLRDVTDREILIEWAEPALYGGVGVKGYQLYMNGRIVGKTLLSSHRKAVIPCRTNRHYRISLVALSNRKGVPDSPESNVLFVSTSPEQRPLTLFDQLESATSDDSRDLPIRATERSDTTITLDWLEYNEPEDVIGYQVVWSSVARPDERQQKLGRQKKCCVLENLLPGTRHLVRVVALGEEDEAIDKSRQITVQTSAPIDTPILRLKACNFSYITVEWNKPSTYGDALVSAYKVFINGVVEAVLSAEETRFSFTEGKGCHDYTFQVQANALQDRYSSKPSEPVVVTWPGCQAPSIRRVATVTSNSIRIAWDDPFLTEGVKVKQFRVVCYEEESNSVVQSVGPLHPDNREAQLSRLRKGRYSIQLEIYLHGSQSVVLTEPLVLEPALTPDPPSISVSIVGLEERRQLERVATDLVNKRDHLVRNLAGPSQAWGRSLDEQQALSRITESCHEVEDMLEDCFQSMEHYTGHLLAKMTITSVQSSPDVLLCGHKVLVNGKQYGCTLNPGVTSVLIKLGLEWPSHRLSAVAVSDQPYAASVESNVVEVLTEPFQPMAFACALDVHIQGQRWPNKGCCHYQESLNQERRQLSARFNPGFSTRHIPPPVAVVHDLTSGAAHRLIPVGGPSKVTAVFFWTQWCLASTNYMRYFARFASENHSKFKFVAVAHEPEDTGRNLRELLCQVTQNKWTLDIQHLYTLQSDGVAESGRELQNAMELFSIPCVPFLVIVHPEDYIAYRGRFCTMDYVSFASWLSRTLLAVEAKDHQSDGQLSRRKSAGTDQPINSTSCPDANALEQRKAAIRRASLVEGVLRAPGTAGGAILNGPTRYAAGQATEAFGEERPSKARLFSKSARLARKKNSHLSKISINTRPYSAKSSPSSKRSSPERRPQSAKKFH